MNQMLKLTVKEFRTTVKTIHSEKRQTMFLMNEILAGKIRSLGREIKTIGKKMEIQEMKNTIPEIPRT